MSAWGQTWLASWGASWGPVDGSVSPVFQSAPRFTARAPAPERRIGQEVAGAGLNTIGRRTS